LRVSELRAHALESLINSLKNLATQTLRRKGIAIKTAFFECESMHLNLMLRDVGGQRAVKGDSADVHAQGLSAARGAFSHYGLDASLNFAGN